MSRLRAQLIGVCAGALTCLAVPATAAAECQNATAQPDQISVTDYADALLCVVNETRREWGRGKLDLQRNLARAGEWQAADMVGRRFFGHTTPDGATLADRLDRAHFIPRSERFLAGENLAAGHADQGSPAAIVSGWMQSREHRVNLLDDGFTMAGIGVARGWPRQGGWESNVVTIALELGWRTFAPFRTSGSRRN